jgi:hypothetical protein
MWEKSWFFTPTWSIAPHEALTAAFLQTELPAGFRWFNQPVQHPNTKLIDLSTHYVLDSKGLGKMTHALHRSGATEVITITVLDEANVSNDEWSEWSEKNKTDITNSKQTLDNVVCRPEKINKEGPCVKFVRETMEVLKSYQRVTMPALCSSRSGYHEKSDSVPQPRSKCQ